ncbi:MAG: hypothetical protein JWO60_2436, partial [Frankiales bacterium]|nr:hypothetical protein [Frankiales bacterium]
MAYELLNSKVVAVDVTGQRPVLSRRGAMLGYSGRVAFAPVHGQGTGVGGMVGAALASESVPMMASTGDGKALFGHRGLHVTVLDLDGSAPLLVEADRLLVHD